MADARRRCAAASTTSPALILAIETSCDDTCAAVVTRAGEIRVERRLLAGRARPLRRRRARVGLAPSPRAGQRVVDEALARAGTTLDDVELIAVTQGPGLVGALLVGVATAKGLAAARRLPLAAVDHLQGHVAANFLGPSRSSRRSCACSPRAATRCSRASTDHAGYETLGQTLDDAAGEAFDKGARCSAWATRAARRCRSSPPTGDPTAFAFPTAARIAGLDFSFAGLKTALLYKVRDLGPEETRAPRRRPRRELRARDRRGADAARRARAGAEPSRAWRSAAASPRTACCASARGRSASRSTSRRRSCARTTPR